MISRYSLAEGVRLRQTFATILKRSKEVPILMNIPRIRQAISRKMGQAPIELSGDEMVPFSAVVTNSDIQAYLQYCLSSIKYVVSGIVVCDYELLMLENLYEGGPGCFIYPFGYLVVGTSTGGNAVCFHADTGRVYWADHSCFLTDSLFYQNRQTQDWVELSEYTHENVVRAMIQISDDIESFLLELLSENLEGFLRKLDLS